MLRDEMLKILYAIFYVLGRTQPDYYKIADSIIALIDGQRCRWHTIMVDGCSYDQTECGHQIAYYLTEEEKYCPCCGRKIEVVEG